MEIIKEVRKWKDLTPEDRASIVTDRIKNPEETYIAFSKRHNVEISIVKKLENLVKFDTDTASGALITKVMEEDLKVLNKAAKLNVRFADEAGKKRNLQSRDIDTLDKISNTIMKRKVLIDKMQQDEEQWTSNAPIVLTL